MQKIMQAIKNWTVGKPGNEASTSEHFSKEKVKFEDP